jgi:hypothetical protein
LKSLPFRVANLAALLEDFLHQIISCEGSTSAAPILWVSRPSVIRKQGANLFLECGHSIFKRRSGHDGTPALKVVVMNPNNIYDPYNPATHSP